MAKSKTTTTAMAQQQAAMAGGGPNNWQGNVMGNYSYGPANGGYVAPMTFPNWNVSSVTVTGNQEQTSLEVFEELTGLIKLIELKLNLDPKDGSKHEWLEMVMGRIQEETINDTIQRLKALKL